MQVPALDKQLRDAGCTKIYREKVTGARADRRELLNCSSISPPATGWEGATLAELARSYHVGKSTISRLTPKEV